LLERGGGGDGCGERGTFLTEGGGAGRENYSSTDPRRTVVANYSPPTTSSLSIRAVSRRKAASNYSANIANFHWVFFTSQYYILYNILSSRGRPIFVYFTRAKFIGHRALRKLILAITCIYDKNNCIGYINHINFNYSMIFYIIL